MTDPVPASNSGAHSCCAAKHGGGTDAKTAKDPVCGMMVDPAATPHHASHHGEQYHFCSAGCRTKFVAEPVRYLSAGDKEAMVAQPGAIWTCPMHPEVRQDHPGPCPICGMALEPELVTADTGPSGELLDMSRRFWIAVLLTIPVFVLEMGSHLFPALHNLVPARMSGWLQLALATPVVLWAGWPFFERGWVSTAELPKQEPAVSIRASVKPDYIVCLEDGKKLKMLKRHLMTHYQMTPDDYRVKWGLPADYPMVAPSYAEQRRALAKQIGLGTAAKKPRRKK